MSDEGNLIRHCDGGREEAICWLDSEEEKISHTEPVEVLFEVK